MRLLDSETGEFRWVDDPSKERYAILSHVWSRSGEQSYQDLLNIHNSRNPVGEIPPESCRTRHGSSPHISCPSPHSTDPVSDSLGPSFAWLEETKTLLKGRSRTLLHTIRRKIQTRGMKTLVPALLMRNTHLPTTLATAASIPTVPTAVPQTCQFLDDPRISRKVRAACAVAHADGYSYLWIDSCCIDKSSSAELGEAINSMYRWYRFADVCYVHLADVDDSDDPFSPTSQFRSSRWHTRGWTLQELIAPDSLVFLSRAWRPIGTKSSLVDVVQTVTGIDREVLENPSLVFSVSAARRMWWASRRETTRVEDEAYSLMGIFGVHMPTVYGEGRHAFKRLQQEIFQSLPDHSIFAWGIDITDISIQLQEEIRKPDTNQDGLQMLASSPRHFSHSASVIAIRHSEFFAAIGLPVDTPPPEFAITPYGIRARLPVILGLQIEQRGWIYRADCIAILGCRHAHTGQLYTLPLCRSTQAHLRHEYVVTISANVALPNWARLWRMSRLKILKHRVAVVDVLIRHRSSEGVLSSVPRRVDGGATSSFDLVLYERCRLLLERYGYSVSRRTDDVYSEPPERWGYDLCSYAHRSIEPWITIDVVATPGSLPRFQLHVHHQTPVTSVPFAAAGQVVPTSTRTNLTAAGGDRHAAMYELLDTAGNVVQLHATVARIYAFGDVVKYGLELDLHVPPPSTARRTGLADLVAHESVPEEDAPPPYVS